MKTKYTLSDSRLYGQKKMDVNIIGYDYPDYEKDLEDAILTEGVKDTIIALVEELRKNCIGLRAINIDLCECWEQAIVPRD